MPFVSISRDLSKIKTKVALNLTKRQLICFGSAAAMGVPAYIFTRGAIGNSGSALLMITAMFPLFFIGIYEKDGMPAEKTLRDYVRARFAWPGKRPYKTENLYEIIDKEAMTVANQNKGTEKTAVSKHPTRQSAGKRKPR